MKERNKSSQFLSMPDIVKTIECSKEVTINLNFRKHILLHSEYKEKKKDMQTVLPMLDRPVDRAH